MAKENIKLLQEKLMQDEGLQNELQKRVSSQESKDENTLIETILIPFGQELDLPFTLEEYKSVQEEKAQSNTLSEEELEVVSGGATNQEMVGTLWGLCIIGGVAVPDDGETCGSLGMTFCVVAGTTFCTVSGSPDVHI